MHKYGFFICGAPRSGTTLLRSILSSHSKIIVTPESHFFQKWVHRYGSEKIFSTEEKETFLNQMRDWDRFDNFNLDVSSLNEQVMQGCDTVSLKCFFDSLMVLYALQSGKPVWCEKTPYNEYYLDVIFKWYPQSRLIYLLRDPRAVIASLLKTPWASKNIYQHVRQWKKSVHVYLDNKEKFFFLKYEDLVDFPKKNIFNLCSDLGFKFESGMIEQRSESINETRDGWAQDALQKATQKIDTTAKNKWQILLSPSQIWVVERLLQNEMNYFKYRITSSRFSFSGSLKLFYYVIFYFIRKSWSF